MQSREYKYEGNELYLKCTKCGERKNLDSYYKCKTKKFGVYSYCIECAKSTMNKYYARNKDRVLDRQNNHYLENKETILAQRKIYYKEHKGNVLDNHRNYYQLNKHILCTKQKEYYSKNKERIIEYQKHNKDIHSAQIGFNRNTFHQRSKNYVKRYNLKPKLCPICGRDEKIVMHHPSYNSFDDWSRVVFCCRSCHKLIHSGILDCPEPIDLLNLTK